MSTRESFVETFDESTADLIVAAAEEHRNGIHDDPGSDYFRWAIAITIGYECWSHPGYARHHGLELPDADAIRQWIKDHGDLANHDGDVDYLALMAGAYNEYVGKSDEVA